MNLINAKYGNEPGLKAHTHVSDQSGPFATQTIPATVNSLPLAIVSRTMYGWLLRGKGVVWLRHLVGCGHVYGVLVAALSPRALMKVRVDLVPINGARFDALRAEQGGQILFRQFAITSRRAGRAPLARRTLPSRGAVHC